jgi:hypothetical protein
MSSENSSSKLKEYVSELVSLPCFSAERRETLTQVPNPFLRRHANLVRHFEFQAPYSFLKIRRNSLKDYWKVKRGNGHKISNRDSANRSLMLPPSPGMSQKVCAPCVVHGCSFFCLSVQLSMYLQSHEALVGMRFQCIRTLINIVMAPFCKVSVPRQW